MTLKKKMEERKSYMHGDLCLVGIGELPKDLEETKTDVILEGKTNTHKVVKGKIYFKHADDFVFGYLKASRGAYLTHSEHGEKNTGFPKKAPIAAGIYELRRQVEETHEGMRVVED